MSTSRIDSPKDTAAAKAKILFKKRAHRPWKPSLSENVLQNQNDNFPKTYDAQTQIEFIEQQLQNSLSQKNKEMETITQKLSIKEENQNHRLTLGGFLQPKGVTFAKEEESLQKAASLMHELREKELEIQELTNNLKLTQALEQVQQAESIRSAEAKAREAAEEKAVYALSKAQQASEGVRMAEERAHLAEHTSFKQQQMINKLENQLNEVTLSLQTELEARKSFERIMQQFESDLSNVHVMKETINQLQIDKSEQEEKMNLMSHQIEDLELKETALKELEIKFQHLTQHKQVIEDQVTQNGALIKKLTTVINTERNLRKMFEDKTKEIIQQLQAVEMLRKAEEQAKLAAEEKAKQAIEQASKVVMQLLNVQVPH